MPMRNLCRSKWFLSGLSAFFGVAMLAASWIGGHPGLGLVALGIMVAFGVVLLLAGRSETIRGLRGDGRDERFAQIDLRATAFAGTTVLLALMVAWLAAIARGHDGGTYQWPLVVGGLSYLAAVAFLRWRG